MTEQKTDKYLIRLINEHLQAFGPRKTGSNLLINRYLPKQHSLLYRFDKLSQEMTIKEDPHEVQKQDLVKDLTQKFQIS